MTTWYSGWQNATLSYAALPLTQFSKDVLSLWQESTPLDRYTSNPIGMPQRGNSVRAVPNSAYALFADMTEFRQAFDKFINGKQGASLNAAIINGEALSDVWREIHRLKWPANATETDYPSAILSRIGSDQAARIASRSKGKRKSAGNPQPQPVVHQQIVAGHQVMVRAMQQHQDSSAMIRQILKETE